MTVITVRTGRNVTNGGTVEDTDIRDWPSVLLTIDGDITFVWHEFLGSRYRISSYNTDGPWDFDANPRNPWLSQADLGAMREAAQWRSRRRLPIGS